MDKFFKAVAGIKQRGPFFRKMAVFCVIVFFGAFFITNTASAELDTTGVTQAIMAFAIKIFLIIGEICIKLTVFCLYFFIQLAKYNNYIDVPVVQLGWTMVRDISNMFFVIVLLMISIGTILGLEQYQWNKTLVKLILAAVFINFSNMICGLFIDIAHVFTITFVNAVAAAAGGNLIQMFSLDKMYKSVYNTDITSNAEFDTRLFAGTVMALLFAIMALFTMGAYLVVMIARVVVLWVLIILSPLAFILQVIPQTQAYAKEWWDRFGKQVVVAPVIVFFLWLAFATAGSGDLVTSQNGMALPMEPINQEIGNITDTVNGGTEGAGETSVSWSEVSTWESMSNFIIPMALLLVGVGVVSKMGVVGGGAVTKAVDLAKKAATIATGYAAGRWLVGKGAQGAKAIGGGLVKGAKAVGWYAIQGERMKNRILYEYASFQSWRKHGGWQPKLRKDKEGNIEYAKDEKTGQLIKDREGNYVPLYETRDKEGKETGVVQMEYVEPEGLKGHLQKFLSKRVEKEAYGAKRLKRMKDFEKNREELMMSHTSANPSHSFWMSDAERKGMVKMTQKNEETGEIEVKLVPMDIARFEFGMQDMAKSRSEFKTAEYKAMGAKAEGAAPRHQIIKDEEAWGPGLHLKKKEGTTSVTQQKAEHEIRKEYWEANLKDGLQKERDKYAQSEGGKLFIANTEKLKFNTELSKNNEENNRLLLAIKALGAVDERSQRTLLDLLASSKANAETQKDKMTGIQDKAVFRERKEIAQRAKAAIKKAQDEDGEYSTLDTERKRVLDNVGIAENNIKELEASMASLEDGMEGLPSDFRSSMNDCVVRARQESDTILREDGQSDEDFERIKQQKVSDRLKETIKEYVAKNNIENLSNSMQNWANQLLGLEKKKAEKEQQVGRIKDINTEMKGRTMKILDNLSAGGKIHGWDAARAQAEREWESGTYRTELKDLMEIASQRYIWDTKQIDTVNTAYTERRETLKREMVDMNYEATIANNANFRPYLQEMREAGIRPDIEDSSIAMVLNEKEFDGAWIDDAIIPTFWQEEKIARTKKFDINELKGLLKRRGRPEKSMLGERQMDDLANVLKSLFQDQASVYVESFRSGDKNRASLKLWQELRMKKADIDKLDQHVLRDVVGQEFRDTQEVINLIVKRLGGMDDIGIKNLLSRK